MRLERLSLSRRVELVLRTFTELSDGVDNQFVVIDHHQVRARVYEP
jgi:hypothetical protein